MRNVVTTKNFKELEIILSSFKCDKNCPYCTAKITKWGYINDDIHLLSLNVGAMKEMGFTFHYVTIGGNGEPTLHDYEKLKDIVEMFDDWDIPVKRVLTSGNIFRLENKKKYELFVNHGWVFEVTVTSSDINISNREQVYDFNYMSTDAFKNAQIRLNYVLLKRSFDTYVDEINKIAINNPHIQTIAIKLLNVNTKNGKVDNDYSKWIVENAVPKSKREEIAEKLSSVYKYNGESFDTHSWLMDDGREVYFSWKKVEYGLYDLVWYGNRFVNYQLVDIKLSSLPKKVYVASRFIKEKLNGENSFTKDFRTKLIGTEKDFVDFNSHSFIRDGNDVVAQYLGPFYNEKASDGTLTSTACEQVVLTENELIRKCDIFIAYFDDVLSPGGICELTYAATLNKKIIIFHKVEDDITYSLKSSAWYPITFAHEIADYCETICVFDENELLTRIPEAIKNINNTDD